MPTPNRHILWLSIDTYDPHGRLISSHLGARSVESHTDPQGIHDEVLGHLPPSFKQLTGDEVAELLAQAAGAPHGAWEQLSIF